MCIYVNHEHYWQYTGYQLFQLEAFSGILQSTNRHEWHSHPPPYPHLTLPLCACTDHDRTFYCILGELNLGIHEKGNMRQSRIGIRGQRWKGILHFHFCWEGFYNILWHMREHFKSWTWLILRKLDEWCHLNREKEQRPQEKVNCPCSKYTRIR